MALSKHNPARERHAPPTTLCACLLIGGVACGETEVARGDGGAIDAGADRSPDEVGNASEAGAPTCPFTVAAELSPKIQTVGIVTWTADLPELRSARIEFGSTTAYGMVAPVNPVLGDHRTLLLGMKQNRTYHFRVVAGKGADECASPDQTLTTGALLNGLPAIRVVSHSAAAPVFGGFLLTGQYLPVPMGGMPAYIVDGDGDIVWAYLLPKDVTCARMSYDGASVWLNSANTPSTQGVVVRRVAMDGLTEEDFSDLLAGLNHQLVVLPEETVAFNAYGANGCDDIKELSPTGLVRTVANTGTAQGGAARCHIVNLEHSAEDDTLVFSDSDNQVLAKVRRRDGSTVWVLGGPYSTLGTAPWVGSQHGIHLLGGARLLLFNNNMRAVATGAPGTGDGSIALEVMLDLDAGSAAPVWSYQAVPGIPNDIMGDVQRLPNGNTIVAYSVKGVLQEISADGTLLEEWTWPLGASLGYIEKRATLYGPPPR